MKPRLGLSAKWRGSIWLGLMLLGLRVEGCGPAETKPPAGPEAPAAVSPPPTSPSASDKTGGPVTRRELQRQRRAQAKGQP